MSARALVFVLFAVAFAAHCSPTNTPLDAGGGGASDSSLACGPVDVAQFQSGSMNPPHPPFQGKCTQAQIDAYAQCQGAKDTSACAQFGPGQSGADCGACIESQTTAPQWGVIVFSGSTTFFNIEGCVDNALGQVGLEKASGNDGESCGDLLHSSYGCQETACSACTSSDFDACDLATLAPGGDASSAGGCKSFDDAVQDPSGPCAPLFGQSPPPDSENCFPDASIANDAQKQQVDWLQRIVKYMCGVPDDGGA